MQIGGHSLAVSLDYFTIGRPEEIAFFATFKSSILGIFRERPHERLRCRLAEASLMRAVRQARQHSQSRRKT